MCELNTPHLLIFVLNLIACISLAMVKWTELLSLCQSFYLFKQKKDTILSSFKPLQRGIAACMTCPNTKVIRGVHGLLSRLMSFFPTEPVTSNVASKYEELECLYACVSKVVYEGLTNYEK